MFATEADVCDALVQDAPGWTAYPEQGGWDLLLVRQGVQVGVQAKLVGNIHMLLQALPGNPRKEDVEGPCYRAVAVGRWPGRTAGARIGRRNELAALAMRLRLLVLEGPTEELGKTGTWLKRSWPCVNLERRYTGYGPPAIDWRWYRWRPKRPVWTPPFVPDLPAGVPAPSSVSAFQIASVKLERLANEKGWICLSDVRNIEGADGNWNPQTLLTSFFECTGKRILGSRQCKWILHRRWPPPSKRWPAVAAGLKGD